MVIEKHYIEQAGKKLGRIRDVLLIFILGSIIVESYIDVPYLSSILK